MGRAIQRIEGKALSSSRLLSLLMLVATLVACGEAHVVHRDQYVATRHPLAGRDEYVVVRGDTLYGIAFRNGMDFRELAAINGIEAPYTIYVDQLLRLRGKSVRAMSRPPVVAATKPIVSVTGSTTNSVRVEQLPESRPAPVTSRPAATPSAAPASNAASVNSGKSAPATTAAPSAAIIPALSASADGLAWRWPANGTLSDRFMAGDATHQGIDIAGTAGDPVQASADGVVVYSGSGLVGYGELIIIKHSDEWLSAYGHNRKRLVAEGQRVKAGQQIAEMGRTGAPRDELHFEIRRNGRPVDPLQFLPTR